LKIGIVQPVIGSIGGNDMVLDSLINALKDHELILFTFSKPNKKLDGIDVRVKLPKNLPMLGIYQGLLMTQFNYSDCDLIISATGYNVKTKIPLIIYDQNNLAHDFDNTIPLKYQKGWWKYYYLPYRFLHKGAKLNPHAYYIGNSKFSSRNVSRVFNIPDIPTLYPAVNLDEFSILPKKAQICVVGRISPEKNLETTVRILNKVKFTSIIFGNVTKVNEGYLKKLRRMANENIIFITDLPRTELTYLLAESKIIFTSSAETFGISTIEGIASGCIPIVPNNSAHPETVPIDALRYDTEEDAVINLNLAMWGSCAGMSILKENIKQYSFKTFKNNLLNIIDKVMK